MSVFARTQISASLFDLRNYDGYPPPYDLLDIVDASDVTLDEGNIPWGTARLTITTPTAAVVAKLQPGQPYVVAFGTYNWSWRMVVTRCAPTTSGTVELDLATFDTRLLTYTPLAADRACWAKQFDVNAIWRYVVATVFGSPPGDDGRWDIQQTDADVPVTPFRTFQAATNLIPNGSFEYGIVGWTGARSNITQQALQPYVGTYSLRIVPNDASNDSFAYTTVSASPSSTYTIGGSIYRTTQSSASGYARRIVVVATIGGVARVIAMSAGGANTSGRSYPTVTFTTPAVMDGNQLQIRLYNGTATGGSGVYWDGIYMYEGDGLDTDGSTAIGYLDGDTVDGTNGYNYDWQGDPGNSSSTRTPIVNRDPETLTWKPGQSAYDFLEPILQALGLRTFSFAQTESGRYQDTGPRIIQPLFALTTYEYSRRLYYSPLPDNQVALAADTNLYDLDVQSAIGATFPDGSPMYADAVVLHYTWTDNLGAAREAWDTYSPGTSYVAPWTVEYTDTPFPGAGRAVNLYRRLAARRRLITATHQLNARIEPGMLMSITAPDLGSVLGYVDSTSHDLNAGVSVTRIKDAVNYPIAAWLRQPSGKTWTSVPTGTSWNTFTP